jgi:hypothetical protein
VLHFLTLLKKLTLSLFPWPPNLKKKNHLWRLALKIFWMFLYLLDWRFLWFPWGFLSSVIFRFVVVNEFGMERDRESPNCPSRKCLRLSISQVPPVAAAVAACDLAVRTITLPYDGHCTMPPISIFFTRLVAELGHEKREAIWYLGPYTSSALKKFRCFLGWSWQLGPHMETLILPCRRKPTRRRQGISAQHTYQVIVGKSCYNKKL